jgi:hypothetical protein
LNGIDHQELLKGYKFRRIEVLGHNKPPDRVEENDSRAGGAGQTFRNYIYEFQKM